MKTKRNWALLGVSLLLGACSSGPVVEPSWSVMGGSRADGTVKLAYEKRGYLNASDAQGLAVAKKRCAAWGYQQAEAFDYNSTTCLVYGKKRCVTWRVEREYQCTQPKDGGMGANAASSNDTKNNNNININVVAPPMQGYSLQPQ